MGHIWGIIVGLAEINIGILLIIFGIMGILDALKGG